VVSEFRSRQISVIGAVNQPGTYAIHQNVSTLLDMLTLAGGPQESAGGVAFVIRRAAGKAESRIQIDLDELLETGEANLNPVLSAGDVVYVPKAPLIYVYGEVKQAGAFTFRKQLRVLESIALAGGFSDMADRRSVSLIRRAESGEENMYPLDLGRIERGEMPNIYLRDGDVLHVRASAPKMVWTEVLSFLRGIFTFSYSLNR
jgi:polysaccharide export outer membrane protein